MSNLNIILLVVVASFLVALITIPFVIKWAHKSGKLAQINHRTSHDQPTPAMGGIGIFLGVIVVALFLELNTEILAVLGVVSILFITGLKDDLGEMKPLPKLLVQIACASIIMYFGLRIENLHGILGIYEIPFVLSLLVTLFFIVGVTNAFNLIDGINGLAGSIGVINATLFGLIFYFNNQETYALLAFAIVGSLLGFLRYNFGKAKIFMGDTGSLFLGLLMSVFVIKTFQSNTSSELSVPMALGLIFIPVFDTIRLFGKRILEKKSPLKADKNHLHHVVLKVMNSHLWATLAIAFIHMLLLVLVIVAMFYQQEIMLNVVLVSFLGLMVAFFSAFILLGIVQKIKQLKKSMNTIIANNKLLENIGS